jgi:DNA repair protein RecN (Recombination protein N)
VRADLDLDPAAFDDARSQARAPARPRAQAPRRARSLAAHAMRSKPNSNPARRRSPRARARWRNRNPPARLDASRATLTKARTQAAHAASRRDDTLIGELGMGGGAFRSPSNPTRERSRPAGRRARRIPRRRQPGQPARALRKVASGGELSRISLAIEVAALGLDAVPTMVFDEVDSGIGGAVADIVGQKLRALGAKRQALCVTHLPQVAAQGHAHYRVSKAASDGMTQSAVRQLEAKEREEELARMLGGVEVSKEARAAARRLLGTRTKDRQPANSVQPP